MMSNPFQAFRYGISDLGNDNPGRQVGSKAAAAARSKRPPPSSPASNAGPSNANASVLPAPRTVHEKLGDHPLRLMIVGHNPSDHAWRTGHFYSHPSNHMWRLLKKSEIAPSCIRGAEDDDQMVAVAGVGFTDLGNGTPGTDSSQFGSSRVQEWGREFFQRMQRHIKAASAAIGCTCGKCGAPAVVAFSGKRQYSELMKARGASTVSARNARNVRNVSAKREKGTSPSKSPSSAITVGPQTELPPGWPFPPSTEVWVMSSTSGASALTRQQREGPWLDLGERLRQIPWPLEKVPLCVPMEKVPLGVPTENIPLVVSTEKATLGMPAENAPLGVPRGAGSGEGAQNEAPPNAREAHPIE